MKHAEHLVMFVYLSGRANSIKMGSRHPPSLLFLLPLLLYQLIPHQRLLLSHFSVGNQ